MLFRWQYNCQKPTHFNFQKFVWYQDDAFIIDTLLNAFLIYTDHTYRISISTLCLWGKD